MKILNFIFLGFVILLLSNCASLNNYQTAKPLDVKEKVFGVAASAYGLSNFTGDVGLPVSPHLEAFVRRGMFKNFDAGLKLSSGLSLLLDGKYQFIGNKESLFAAAIGTGLEFVLADGFDKIFRTHLPLYFSIHPKEEYAVFASTKYIFQAVSNDDNSNFIGGSLGFQKQFNPKFTGIIETSFFGVYDQQFLSTNENVFQAGVGFIFRLQ